MNNQSRKYYINEFGISDRILDISSEIEKEIGDIVRKIDSTREFNQIKVIRAMQKNKLSDSHFAGTTGYGYNDRGREVLDAVYADVFNTEDALVRHQIVSGTHALAVSMF